MDAQAQDRLTRVMADMARMPSDAFRSTILDALDGAEPRGTIVEGRRVLPFSELAQASRHAASGLSRLGVGHGDRVAVWLPDGAAWLVLFLACVRLGAVAVAVNTRFRSHELGDILERSGARVLALSPGFKGIPFDDILREVEPAALGGLQALVPCSNVADGSATSFAGLQGRRHVSYADLISSPAGPPPAAVSPADGCIVFTTSGTTRAPKFVLHSLRTLSEHAHDVCRAFELGPHSAVLLSVPLCGVFGFVQAMAALLAGCRLCLAPVFDARAAAATVREHGITHLVGSDAMFSQLLDADDGAFPSLMCCAYGAFSPGLAGIAARAKGRGLALRGLYGSSEVQALFAVQDGDLEPPDRALAGGRPVSPHAAARARDAHSGAILLHGEVGELEVRGPSLMLGYLGNDEATRAAFTADGWFRTGDSGYTVADGRFVYLSRLGDALRLGGYLVAPAEIEAVVLEDRAIADCQVVGVQVGPDFRAVAFVILRGAGGGQTSPDQAALEASVIRRCRARMAAYKAPARVFAVEAFPVTHSANATKVQKNRLQQLATELLAAEIADAQPRPPLPAQPQ
jgi:fatty-acyl-CoA synthase